MQSFMIFILSLICFLAHVHLIPKNFQIEGYVTKGKVRWTISIVQVGVLAAFYVKNPQSFLQTAHGIFVLLSQGAVFQFFMNIVELYLLLVILSGMFVLAPLGIITILYLKYKGVFEEK